MVFARMKRVSVVYRRTWSATLGVVLAAASSAVFVGCAGEPQPADLARIAAGKLDDRWDDISSDQALSRLHRLGDQAALVQVASASQDPEVREHAILALTDQAALAKLARELPEEDLRLAAVAMLEDQRVLATIAQRDASFSVRVAAAAKVTDQALLAAIATGGSDMSGDAVRRLNDPVLLAKIAKKEVDAVGQISNLMKDRLDDLAFFAKIGVSPDLPQMALTDQRVLAAIAVGDRRAENRQAVVPHLSDRAVLARIADRDPNGLVRLAAAVALASQSLVARIALTDKDPFVRRDAAAHVTDPGVLAKIATGDQYPWVRRVAISRLTDQAILGQIVAEERFDETLSVAVSRLTDQGLLTKLAGDAKNRTLQSTAFLNCIARAPTPSDGRCGNPAQGSYQGWSSYWVRNVEVMRALLAHPIVAGRYPRLQVRFRWEQVWQNYRPPGGGERVSLDGERVTWVVLSEDDRQMAEGAWGSVFEQSVSASDVRTFGFVLANVNFENLFRAVLASGPALTSQEIDLLLGSADGVLRTVVPRQTLDHYTLEGASRDLMGAATALSTDQRALVRLMLDAKEASVRGGAARQLMRSVKQP